MHRALYSFFSPQSLAPLRIKQNYWLTSRETHLNPGVITVPPIRTMFSASCFLVSIGHWNAKSKKWCEYQRLCHKQNSWRITILGQPNVIIQKSCGQNHCITSYNGTMYIPLTFIRGINHRGRGERTLVRTNRTPLDLVKQ